MTTITARAIPWRRGWELHIDGVGVTQVARLAQSRHRAERAAADQRAAAAATRGVIQQLIAAGIRATDIAFLLGISRARVAQLAKG